MHNTGQNIGGQAGVPNIDIDAPEAWNVPNSGAEVIVAVIDTGVDINHPDLAGRIWTNPGEIPNNGVDDDLNGYIDDVNGWDFHNNDKTVFDNAYDDHGTHVAGTIAATFNNVAGVTGVAPNVKIMPLKFLGSLGGYTSNAIAAINYAKNKGVRISNNSWGGPASVQDDSALKDAINNSNQVFVAAAGNDTVNNDVYIDSPSGLNSTNIIAVASVDNQGNLSTFSNFGATTVDIGAPGTNIFSTLPGSQYGFMNGTSMAAPHVAGVAALVYTINPTLSPQQINQILMDTGTTQGLLNTKTQTGKMVNAYNAIIAARVVAPTLTLSAKTIAKNGDTLTFVVLLIPVSH
ncbi:MAG: S8 family peptidase [Thermincolia bacterium]